MSRTHFTTARLSGSFGVTVVFATLMWWSGRAAADPILPGYDLWHTPEPPGMLGDPPASSVRLFPGDAPLNFFEPGSDPFMGTFQVQGMPISSIGNGDTIVERKPPGLGSGGVGPIPIELVSLSLVSVQPITVSYNGGTSSALWDVHIGAMSPQTNGQTTVTQHNDPNGGTFDSSIPVLPKFTFTKVGSPSTPAVTFMPSTDEILQILSGPWSHMPKPMYAENATYPSGGFYPGVIPPNVSSFVAANSLRMNLIWEPACVPEARPWLMLGAVVIGIIVIQASRRLRWSAAQTV